MLALLSEGLSPSQIAKQCAVPTRSVIQHLSVAVNKGQVLGSDVLSTLLNKEWRVMADILADHPDGSPERICDLLNSAFAYATDIDELNLYLAYRKKPIHAGDIYGLLYEIERTLHELVRTVLVREYGPQEAEWWGQGVPINVRVACAQAREQDAEFVNGPYNYTTLINLACILDKNWRLFEIRLPATVAHKKSEFMRELTRMNGVRNRVMHPVRGEPPTEEELEFVKKMQEKLHVSKWRPAV